MAFFRARGGSIFEMDPPNPKLPHQVELRAEKLRKGDLVEVPADTVIKVDVPGGGFKWIEIQPAADAEPESTADADGSAAVEVEAVKPPSKAELLERATALGIDPGKKPTIASLTAAIAAAIAAKEEALAYAAVDDSDDDEAEAADDADADAGDEV